MKYLLLAILFCSCGVSKNTQNRNLEEEIISFLLEKKQITQTQKNKIKNNFDGYITIESLRQQNFDKKDGVYIFSVNSSHNYKYFLLVKSNDFKIVNVNDDIQKISTEIFDYGIVLTDMESEEIEDAIVNNKAVKSRLYIKNLNQ